MRVSRQVLAIEPEQTVLYRTMTAAVRQYNLDSAEHLKMLIESGEEYRGVYFDYATELPSGLI